MGILGLGGMSFRNTLIIQNHPIETIAGIVRIGGFALNTIIRVVATIRLISTAEILRGAVTAVTFIALVSTALGCARSVTITHQAPVGVLGLIGFGEVSMMSARRIYRRNALTRIGNHAVPAAAGGSDGRVVRVDTINTAVW